MSLVDVLLLIRPGAEWSLSGDSYDGLLWLDADQNKPSEQECLDGELLVAWAAVRSERDRLLAACDWTQVADAPLTAAEKQAWSVYRQALRDIPQDFATPDDVVWPEVP